MLALLAAWPWIGLFGHEPWKADEAYTFGLIYSYVEGKDWLVPVLADSYFLEKPPIFFWAGAASARLFGGLLPLPEAARLVVPLFLYVTLGSLMATGAILLGRARAWLPPLLFIGALGLFDKVHMLVTDAALIAGISVGFLGLALAPRRPNVAGLALGTGAALAFMSKGLLGPGILASTAMAMLVCGEGRSPAAIRSLLVAAGVGLPLVLLWPAMLYFKSPELFWQWLWVNNFGRFFGFVRLGQRHDVWFYPVTLLWLSFPLWPLALLGVIRGIKERGIEERGVRSDIALPTAAFTVTAGILMLSTDSRTLYALPLLLPLSLLAATGLERVPATAAQRMHRAQRFIFALAVARSGLAGSAL